MSTDIYENHLNWFYTNKFNKLTEEAIEAYQTDEHINGEKYQQVMQFLYKNNKDFISVSALASMFVLITNKPEITMKYFITTKAKEAKFELVENGVTNGVMKQLKHVFLYIEDYTIEEILNEPMIVL